MSPDAPLWQTIVDDVAKLYGPAANLLGNIGRFLFRGRRREAANAEGERTSTVPGLTVRLVGRDAEVSELLDLFADGARTILIHGMPGVGKSAIATRIADAMFDDREAYGEIRRFYWISAKAKDDSEVRDTSWLIDQFYRQLGFAESSGEAEPDSKQQQIAASLSEIPTFFLIDNFESFADPRVLDYVLALPANTRSLITSRISVDPTLPLHSYPLRPLDRQTSIFLLLEECERTRLPAPSANECNLIARESGGSPYAIRSTVGLMTEGYPASRALAVLRDGRADLFSALFTEHWEGLSDLGRATLVGSAMLGETFSRPLLDGFFGAPADVQQLIRRRLIDSRDESGSGLRLTLHPLTRTFAQARASDATDTTELVFTLARTLTSYFNDRRLLQLGRDEYLSLDHDIGSVLKVAHRLAPALDATGPNRRACLQFRDLFFAVSVPLWSFGYWANRVELGRRTIQACELAGDTDAAARAAATVGIVKYWQGDTDAAEAYGRRALDFIRGSSNGLDAAIGERVLALAKARRGGVDEAVDALRNILAELATHRDTDHERVRFFADWPCRGPRGHESGLVALHQEIGIMLVNSKRYEEALDSLEASRELAEEIDDDEGLSISWSHLGRCHLGLRDITAATECFEHGLDLAKAVRRMSTLGRCLLGLAQVAGEHERRRRGEVEAYGREAAAVFSRLGMAEELAAAETILTSRGGRR